MKDVLTGRADLARAYLSGGDELQKAVAGLLGFESLTPRVHRLEAGSRIGVQIEPSFTAAVEPEPPESTVNLPFWQPTSFQVFESAAVRLREQLVVDDDRDGVLLEQRAGPPVEFARLASRVEALVAASKGRGTRGESAPSLISIRSSSG